MRAELETRGPEEGPARDEEPDMNLPASTSKPSQNTRARKRVRSPSPPPELSPRPEPEPEPERQSFPPASELDSESESESSLIAMEAPEDDSVKDSDFDPDSEAIPDEYEEQLEAEWAEQSEDAGSEEEWEPGRRRRRPARGRARGAKSAGPAAAATARAPGSEPRKIPEGPLVSIGVVFREASGRGGERPGCDYFVERHLEGCVIAPLENGFPTLTQAAIAHDRFLLTGAGGVRMSKDEARRRGLNADLGVHQDPEVLRLLASTSPDLAFSLSKDCAGLRARAGLPPLQLAAVPSRRARKKARPIDPALVTAPGAEGAGAGPDGGGGGGGAQAPYAGAQEAGKVITIGVTHVSQRSGSKGGGNPYYRASRNISGRDRYPPGGSCFGTPQEAAVAHDIFLLNGAGRGWTRQEARDKGLNVDLNVHQDPRVLALLEGTTRDSAFSTAGNANKWRTLAGLPPMPVAGRATKSGAAAAARGSPQNKPPPPPPQGPFAAMPVDLNFPPLPNATMNAALDPALMEMWPAVPIPVRCTTVELQSLGPGALEGGSGALEGMRDGGAEAGPGAEAASSMPRIPAALVPGSPPLPPGQGHAFQHREGSAGVDIGGRPAAAAAAAAAPGSPMPQARGPGPGAGGGPLTLGVSRISSNKVRPWRASRVLGGKERYPSVSSTFSTMEEAAIAHDLFLLEEGGGIGLSRQEARDRGLNYDLKIHQDPRVAFLLLGTDISTAFRTANAYQRLREAAGLPRLAPENAVPRGGSIARSKTGSLGAAPHDRGLIMSPGGGPGAGASLDLGLPGLGLPPPPGPGPAPLSPPSLPLPEELTARIAQMQNVGPQAQAHANHVRLGGPGAGYEAQMNAIPPLPSLAAPGGGHAGGSRGRGEAGGSVHGGPGGAWGLGPGMTGLESPEAVAMEDKGLVALQVQAGWVGGSPSPLTPWAPGLQLGGDRQPPPHELEQAQAQAPTQ